MDGISAEMDGLMETEGVKRGKKGVFEAFCGVCRKKIFFSCIQVKIMVYYRYSRYILADIADLRYSSGFFTRLTRDWGQTAGFGRLECLFMGDR